MRAAYLLDPATQHPGRLAALAGAGLDTVITKAAAVTPGFAAAARGSGLRVIGSVPCFRAGAGPHADTAGSGLPPDAELRPVDADGRRWQRMKWYEGLIPSHDRYNRALVRHCARAAASPDLDGLALDFLRWPLHWELELRPGSRPRDGSYDPITLADFEHRTGLHPPGPTGPGTGTDPGTGHDARAAARWIGDRHREAWHAYRTATVTAVATAVRAAVHAVRPELWTGVFLVPAPEEQRRDLLGQDTAALGGLFDAVLVMSYHAILRHSPDLPARAAAEARRHTDGPVVPMVQVTADPAYARGADWGAPVGAAEYAEALAGGLHAGRGYVCLFPGEALDDELLRLTRQRITAAHLAEPSGAARPGRPRRRPEGEGPDE
ncbi:hypothetical protein [Kitasatospora sp. NPDC057015]|uniref:hypothetical protein n=1 Tax=Kitasatospora sp. NPDC057015 TaxID=3346001 RepID=UPI00363DF307